MKHNPIEITYAGVELQIEVESINRDTGEFIEGSIRTSGNVIDLLQSMAIGGWRAYDQLLGKAQVELAARAKEATRVE